MAYVIELTQEDADTIAFVGLRYSWAAAMLPLDVGRNELSEPEAWDLAASLEEDAEGGHGLFPMLGAGPLRDKLYVFLDSIV